MVTWVVLVIPDTVRFLLIDTCWLLAGEVILIECNFEIADGCDDVNDEDCNGIFGVFGEACCAYVRPVLVRMPEISTLKVRDIIITTGEILWYICYGFVAATYRKPVW